MQRKFLINLGFLLLLNLLIKPVWIFGIDRTVQNTVGTGEYGFYFVVFNFSFLFNILLDMGITNFNNRNIAQHSQLLNKHFSGILVLKFLLGFVYLFVTFLVAFLQGYNATQMKLLGLLGFNQFLLSFILYLRSNISGLLFFKTDSVLSVLDRFLMILFCGVLLWGHVTEAPFQIEWFVYCQTTAYLITAAIAFIIVVRKAKFRSLNWNWPFFLMILKQSYPFALLVLIMMFYARLDPILLEGILKGPQGNDEAGIFASGFRLLDAANMIAFLFSVLLIPIFSKMIKKKEPVNEMLKLSFTLMFTFSVIVVTGSFFYAYEIIDLLYWAHVEQSTAVFRFLIIGFVGVSTSYIFGTLLTANGNLKQLNIIALISLVINISVNLVLIPKLLATGSAIASLSAHSFAALAQVILVQRIFRLEINWRFVTKLILFAATVIALNALSQQIPLPDPGWHPQAFWIMKLGTVGFLSLLLAFALKLIHLRSLLQIMKKEA